MLILPVRFPVVTNNPVRIGRRSAFRICRIYFSMQNVIHSLKQTISKVHVSYWVDIIEMDTSWELSIGMSPFVLNSFHMPLIDNYNNFITFAFIYLLEEILVPLIDENAL